MTMNYRAVIAKNHQIRRDVEGPSGFDSACPPQAVLDKIADRKISGGYSLKRSNLCTVCNTYKSVNGECVLC